MDPNAQTDTYAAVTFLSTTGAGRAFRSTFAAANVCRSGSPISPSLQFGAASLFDGMETGDRASVAESADPADPAGRRHLAALSVEAARRGYEAAPVSMDFNYGTSFGERSPSAYETLLVDAMSATPRSTRGRTWWKRAGPRCSRFSTTVSEHPTDFPNYAAGTWGPKAADEMLARNGHVWRTSVDGSRHPARTAAEGSSQSVGRSRQE